MTTVLVANRGEVALRVMATARARGYRTVAVFAEDESEATHVAIADESVALSGRGPAAYLDHAQICAAALRSGAELVHPGYGFLSESASFAAACEEAGLTFVGPDTRALRLLGDKSATRDLADAYGIPVLPATTGATTNSEAERFVRSLPTEAVMVKALAGGGGRGMRIVEDPRDLERALARCRSEALRSFGVDDVYVEAYLPRARHVEVQVIGDGGDHPMHLFDRDCTAQRRHQKMVEYAPSDLPAATREALYGASLTLAAAAAVRGLTTFEYLIDADDPTRWFFIEANPRLQVEHGITECITGLDLVGLQFDIAEGRTLPQLQLSRQTLGEPRGFAIEARITGHPRPHTTGLLRELQLPDGPGIRVDTHLRPGTTVGTDYDPLLAKIIVHSVDGARTDAVTGLAAAVQHVVMEPLDTDLDTLSWLLSSAAFRDGLITTRTVDAYLETDRGAATAAGSVVDIVAPSRGVVVALNTAVGTSVRHGQTVLTIESMKMETDLPSPTSGLVLHIDVETGDTVEQGETVAVVRADDGDLLTADAVPMAAPHTPRSDLAELTMRRERTADRTRTVPVSKRHARGKRTVRENITHLLRGGDFVEYGNLVIAAQRARRSVEDLEIATPADGVVTGFGGIDNHHTIAVVAYDQTVLAGTQGLQGHKKVERILDLAARRRTPVVVFAEGGGGRPGDTDDMSRATRMDLGTFVAMGRLNGVVPTAAIVTGRCFAGNAALAGCCDVIIATRDSTIGLGGPAMIEGGGLGSFAADDIGPVSVQEPNGVIDVVVDDEHEAVETARRYLRYVTDEFVTGWLTPDQEPLREIVPERRNRPFDMRRLLHILTDEDSVLELRPRFGAGLITALARIDGMAVGVVANDGNVVGGTIGRDEADKMARFLQLCNTHGLPVVSLCDTAGFMVGPEAERTATVRHVSRLFVTAPVMDVPFCAVIVRKAYGLGGQAMAGGSFRVPDAIVAWPTGALGAMGPEGAVKLGYRRELDSVDDPELREQMYRSHLSEYIDAGRAVNAASVFEIDDVIDPACTRSWITATFRRRRDDRSGHRTARRIDTW